MVSLWDPHDRLAGGQNGPGLTRRVGQETEYHLIHLWGLRVEPLVLSQLWRHFETHAAQSPRTQELLWNKCMNWIGECDGRVKLSWVRH